MALLHRTTAFTTVRRARVPVMLAPTNGTGPRFVRNAAGYRSIGSLQALALAMAAALVTAALFWLVV